MPKTFVFVFAEQAFTTKTLASFMYSAMQVHRGYLRRYAMKKNTFSFSSKNELIQVLEKYLETDFDAAFNSIELIFSKLGSTTLHRVYDIKVYEISDFPIARRYDVSVATTQDGRVYTELFGDATLRTQESPPAFLFGRGLYS